MSRAMSSNSTPLDVFREHKDYEQLDLEDIDNNEVGITSNQVHTPVRIFVLYISGPSANFDVNEAPSESNRDNRCSNFTLDVAMGHRIGAEAQ